MKNYKKYIFDLDYTLLIPDWSLEDEYFKKIIPINKQEDFFKQKQSILDRYELEFSRYDFKSLSNFFKLFGFSLSEEVIKGWMIYNGENIKDIIVDSVFSLFEYLKFHDKEIVIITNWFSETQISRLKRAGLYDYIDNIITGEDSIKPDLKAFELAVGDTPKEDCIMIGDSIRSDKIGAERALIDYYIVDKEHSMRDLLQLVINSKNSEIHLVKKK